MVLLSPQHAHIHKWAPLHAAKHTEVSRDQEGCTRTEVDNWFIQEHTTEVLALISQTSPPTC